MEICDLQKRLKYYTSLIWSIKELNEDYDEK